jgi:hypothetical protein
MLLGNSNLWLNLREIQINSVLLIGQLELFITKNPLYPVLFFKRYCFQLSPRKTHCKFDPRVLGHPVYGNTLPLPNFLTYTAANPIGCIFPVTIMIIYWSI